MTKAFEINAQSRSYSGRAINRRLRHLQQVVPAVIYGGGEATQSISLLHKDLGLMLSNEAAYSHILKLNLDGQIQQVVLKAIQRHPFKPQILHVDFLRIRANEQLTMKVPLHFIGEDRCLGVKAGGLVSKLMTDVEIKCLPADLPEFIEMDISNLELDHSYHLSDLQLPKGVEFAIAHLDDEHNLSIVSVRPPRIEKEVTIEEIAPAEGEEAKGKAEGKEEGESKKE